MSVIYVTQIMVFCYSNPNRLRHLDVEFPLLKERWHWQTIPGFLGLEFLMLKLEKTQVSQDELFALFATLVLFLNGDFFLSLDKVKIFSNSTPKSIPDSIPYMVWPWGGGICK
jgi:hypothetical protein